MRILMALSVIALCAPAAAFAGNDAGKDKLVCKRNHEHVTGSNLQKNPSRICKKASQWAAEQAQLEADLRAAQERGGLLESPSPAMGPSSAPQ